MTLDIVFRAFSWIGYLFMPLVTCYHLVTGNVFFNTAATDAKHIEKLGNTLLIPFQYLFAGNLAIPCQEQETFYYIFKQRFTYEERVLLKSAASLVSLPVSLVLGSALKGIAYLAPEAQARHFQIAHAFSPDHIRPNTELYQKIGLNVLTPSEKIPSLGYLRQPGDENNLRFEKEALRAVVSILKNHEIPFWADCGTALGAYRYGGSIPWDNDIDIAVLQPDFDNVRHALCALDPSKYLVEDWSDRKSPKTYLRVYVKKTRTFIDIFHFEIHPESQTLCSLLSGAKNHMFSPAAIQFLERFEVETPISVIFPLKIASFDGIDLPVPHHTKKYLQMRYGEDLSPVKLFDLKTGSYEKDLGHPYWQEVAVF